MSGVSNEKATAPAHSTKKNTKSTHLLYGLERTKYHTKHPRTQAQANTTHVLEHTQTPHSMPTYNINTHA